MSSTRATHPERLFELPPARIDRYAAAIEARDNIIGCMAQMETPQKALRYGATTCVRQAHHTLVEAGVHRYGRNLYESIPVDERTAFDVTYMAALSYDAELSMQAFEALDKMRLRLEESADTPEREEVQQLYSAAILLAQASPSNFPAEILTNVSLLRAKVWCGGVFNAFEVLKNLAFELRSDHGAIIQGRIYEHLFRVFKESSEGYPWIEPSASREMSARDFAQLIKVTMKGGNTALASELSADLPSQLELRFS